MNRPTVSVIIPCSRPLMAEKTIKSIQKQDYPLSKVEIIIVGKDNSNLKQERVAKIIKGSFYPGQARNLGAKGASGEYFLFVDDDCETEKHWITENLRVLQNQEIGAVSGMVIGKSDRFFARCIDFSNFDLCQTKRKCERALCSATMGTRREVFRQTSGFDENLRVGEDIDFCYRLIQKGYKTVYEPRIQVFHDHRQDTLRKILSYMYFGGRKSGLYFQKRYADLNRGSKFFSKIQSPFLFGIFILPVSLLMALKSLKLNFKEHKKMLIYFPFIFLAKLSYNIGIFFWIIKEKNKLYA